MDTSQLKNGFPSLKESMKSHFAKSIGYWSYSAPSAVRWAFPVRDISAEDFSNCAIWVAVLDIAFTTPGLMR